MEEAERGAHLSESAQKGPRAPRVSIRRARQCQLWNRQYRQYGPKPKPSKLTDLDSNMSW